MTQIVLYLKTSNDVNGNPRRLYLPLDPYMGDPITHVIEEGYRGRAGLEENIDGGYEEIQIEVPVSEYKKWIRYGKHQGFYVP